MTLKEARDLKVNDRVSWAQPGAAVFDAKGTVSNIHRTSIPDVGSVTVTWDDGPFGALDWRDCQYLHRA